MSSSKEHIDYSLIAKYLAGEASPEEAQNILSWKSKSRENEEIFASAERLLASGSKIIDLEDAQFNTEIAWEKVQNRIEEEQTEENVRSLIPWKYAVAVAAVFILAMVFFIFNPSFLRNEDNLISLVPTQETNQFILPDSTSVAINAGAMIEYDQMNFGSTDRKVYLGTGEVYFDVAHNPEKPFIIHTDRLEIKVLGTKFIVTEDKVSQSTTVKVIEGKVSFKKLDMADKAQIITRDRQMSYSADEDTFESINEIKDLDLFWVNQLLIFRETSLNTVFHSLSKNYNVTIDYDTTNLSDCELTARFEGETIDEIASSIALSMNLRYTLANDTLQFIGQGCAYE